MVGYASTADVPESIPRRTLAIVGDPPVWAVFECPCGRGHRIMVRTAPHPRIAHWSLYRGTAGPTLWPSIESVSDFGRCHFWLTDGQASWVGST